MVDGVYTVVQAMVANPDFKAGTDYALSQDITFSSTGADFSSVLLTERAITEINEALGLSGDAAMTTSSKTVASYALTSNTWKATGTDLKNPAIKIDDKGFVKEEIPTYDRKAFQSN